MTLSRIQYEETYRHPNFQSFSKMADKIEEIVRCVYCDGLRPLSEHEQHLKDGCPAQILYSELMKSYETNDDLCNEPLG